MPLRNGQVIEVLDRGSTHKWLGCMLCTASTPQIWHIIFRLRRKRFLHTDLFLVNRNVAMRDRFKYFDAMVTPVACFGAAHRKVYKQDLCRMDIVFRRLLRSIVGPPGDVDWTLPWHEILHHWNERVKFFNSSSWLENMVCCVPGTLLEICELCFHFAKRAMGCWSIELAPRTCSTSWPPCLQLGLNDSIFLQAQTNRKLATLGTLCPRHSLLD